MKNKSSDETRAVKHWVFEAQTPISVEEAQEIGDLGTEDDETEGPWASEEKEQRGGEEHEEAKREGPGTN